jgi:hypothetical protein
MTTMSEVHNTATCTADAGEPCAMCKWVKEAEFASVADSGVSEVAEQANRGSERQQAPGIDTLSGLDGVEIAALARGVLNSVRNALLDDDDDEQDLTVPTFTSDWDAARHE